MSRVRWAFNMPGMPSLRQHHSSSSLCVRSLIAEKANTRRDITLRPKNPDVFELGPYEKSQLHQSP